MPRRKRTPEEVARKAKVRELMQELDINDMSDIKRTVQGICRRYFRERAGSRVGR